MWIIDSEHFRTKHIMQLLSGLLNTILSPLKNKGHARVLSDSSSDDEEAVSFRQSMTKKGIAMSTNDDDDDTKRKKKRKMSPKRPQRNSSSTRRSSIRSLNKSSYSSRRGMNNSSKKLARKAVTKSSATKHKVKVKTEPTWERRSRRKSRGYKKGSLSESSLTSRAWSGSGTREDPLVLH